MSSSQEVSIISLIEISKQFIESFFVSNDIYSLLLLSLITVTTYSRKNHKLQAQTRVDLSIAFLPDLVQSLINDKIITSDIGRILIRQYESRRNELPLILQAYIYAARGLSVKIDKPEVKEKKCLFS